MKTALERILKGIAFPLAGIGVLILCTIIGLVVDKSLAEKAKKEEAALKKAMITPTSIPTETPKPTSVVSPTPTAKISSMSAILVESTASATVSPTVKITSTPTVKPATPTIAP